MSERRRWVAVAGVCAILLARAAAVDAGDVETRVAGVVPFPAHERPGANVDVPDADWGRIPQPAWVDEKFWDELVFDAVEGPVSYTERRTNGLTDDELAELDIYIRTTAPEAGVEPVSEDMLTWWRQAIPEAVREFTGQPWRGRITTGTDSRELTPGRVNVGIGTEADFAAHDDTCAFASIGYYAFPDGSFATWAEAEILFNPDGSQCIFRQDSQGGTMAHEIGHVLGLYHVSDPAAIMYRLEGFDQRYTQQLVDHAQLLYDLGPGLAYPGFGPAIQDTTPDQWTGSVEQVTYYPARGVLTGRAWHNGGGHDVVTERHRVVAYFVDAATDVIGEPVRSSHGERIGADTAWEFELPEREGWDRVFLVSVVFLGSTDEDGFVADCTDADRQAQSGTVTFEDRAVSACVYRRSDIQTAAEEPDPRAAVKDLEDRALEELQSQEDEDASAVDSLEAEPVPVFPIGGVGLLACWLLLMGCWRRRTG